MRRTETPEATPEDVLCNEWFPDGIHGADMFGRPVLYTRVGPVDVPGVVAQAGLDSVIRHCVANMSRALRILRGITVAEGTMKVRNIILEY
jgi:hypothetical protein